MGRYPCAMIWGLSGDEILEKLQIKFHLSHEEAEQYVLDSGI